MSVEVTDPLITSEEYDGTKCPKCGSQNITQSKPYHPSNSRTIFVDTDCDDCRAVWTETYNLDGYEDLEIDE